MRAGQMRHRGILQSPGGDRDASGDRQTTWTNVATVWASIEPLTTSEKFVAAQVNAFTTHKVCIRYSSEIESINNSWRFVVGSRIFVLDGSPINVNERNKELELMCVESARVE